jgi:hypothetical protein
MNLTKFILLVIAIAIVICLFGALLSFIEHAKTVVGLGYASCLALSELPLHERVALEWQAIEKAVRARCEHLLLDADLTQQSLDAAKRAHKNNSSAIATQVGWRTAEALHTNALWNNVGLLPAGKSLRGELT